MSQVPMAATLLQTSIYGNMPGLLISGPLIARFGYPAAAALYCAIGLAFALLIGVRWRAHLWRIEAHRRRVSEARSRGAG